jgi:putative nucleotidyltransferase with HDIG domain
MHAVDIADQLSRLPAQPTAALLVLRVVEDPDASPAELGRIVAMDPALSVRVMRLANAPHNGPGSVVHSAERAVYQLGFTTVKAIAAAAASTLLADDVRLGPPSYWIHSIAVASGAAVASDVLGIAENEAFSAGLLHDIGSAVLHRSDPARYDDMVAGVSPGQLGRAERELFGTTHPETGARALELWHFPPPLVEAIRDHHEPVSSASPLTQAVILGEALAERVEPLHLAEGSPRLGETVAALGLAPAHERMLVERTRSEIDKIAAFLGVVR